MHRIFVTMGMLACTAVLFGTSCKKTDHLEGPRGKVTTIKDYTLVVTNKDSSFSPDTKQWMINTFFTVYPEEVSRFNLAAAPRKVVFVIDPAFNKGKAETKDSVITFNPHWFQQHPNDIDLVTRQLMYVACNYPDGAAPSWVTSGLADYARYKFGVDNEEAGWTLPRYNNKQSYKDGDTVTARFFVWIEKRVESQALDKLNRAIRENGYADSLWQQITGRTLPLLWQLYDSDPSINTTDPPGVFAREANAAQASLMKQFWSASGHYFVTNNHGNQGYNYWWNAHGLDVLIDGYIRTGDDSYKSNADLIYEGMRSKNGNTFINTYNDDMEWMAIACLRAYNATHQNQYKATADQLWSEIRKSWSSVMGGGITWKTDNPNGKNACSNGPAAILAARLYELDHDTADLNWAKKIFAWEKDSLVDPVTGVVWDNISISGGVTSVQKNWTFTYNQGTYIGAATELFRITGDSSYLDEAVRTASYVVDDRTLFSPDGILLSEGQGDGGLFKGIFVRYLNELITSGFLDPATQHHYISYLVANGNSLMNNASFMTLNGVIFNPNWSTRPGNGDSDASVQLSGVILYEALAYLQKFGFIH